MQLTSLLLASIACLGQASAASNPTQLQNGGKSKPHGLGGQGSNKITGDLGALGGAASNGGTADDATAGQPVQYPFAKSALASRQLSILFKEAQGPVPANTRIDWNVAYDFVVTDTTWAVQATLFPKDDSKSVYFANGTNFDTITTTSIDGHFVTGFSQTFIGGIRIEVDLNWTDTLTTQTVTRHDGSTYVPFVFPKPTEYFIPEINATEVTFNDIPPPQ